jgi:hypothetical protein
MLLFVFIFMAHLLNLFEMTSYGRCLVLWVCDGAFALCADGGEFFSQSGNTALIWAAVYGRAECVRLLIDAGADKEVKDVVRIGRPFAAAFFDLHQQSYCFFCYTTFYISLLAHSV